MVAIAVLLVDQLSKWWATSTLEYGERTPLLGDVLSLYLTRNPGAAFSFGTGATWVFTVISAGAALVVAWFATRARSRTWAILLGLLLGGAATHLADRLFRPPGFGRGEVVDFIEYGHLFIGNVADLIIVGSVLGIVVLLGVESRRPV